MRNRELHDALREFALESAATLSTELDAGEELPYDVIEEPGTGSVLYRYLPLTAEFIVARWDVLSKMPSARRAAESLGTGSEAYLRLRGLPAANDAEAALRAMLDRLYEDATDFQFPEERFERVYAEVERTLYEGTMRTAVVATVQGLVLESERVELTASVRHGGRVAWSLGRFEMGCECSTDPDALSDNLLAIRSLLEADDDAGRASLAQRLAALCSEEPHRAATRARLEAGFALERRLMAGVAGGPHLGQGGEATPRPPCGGVRHHRPAPVRRAGR